MKLKAGSRSIFLVQNQFILHFVIAMRKFALGLIIAEPFFDPIFTHFRLILMHVSYPSRITHTPKERSHFRFAHWENTRPLLDHAHLLFTNIFLACINLI
jgi:hypothetical protein